MSELTENPAGSPRIVPIEEVKKAAPKQPSPDVEEKQESLTEDDRDKATRRKAAS